MRPSLPVGSTRTPGAYDAGTAAARTGDGDCLQLLFRHGISNPLLCCLACLKQRFAIQWESIRHRSLNAGSWARQRVITTQPLDSMIEQGKAE